MGIVGIYMVFNFFIEVQLIYNIVLIIAGQKSDSDIYIYICMYVCIYTPTPTFFSLHSFTVQFMIGY